MSKNKRMKRMPLRGLSIQYRLPLFICILVLGVVIAFGWISYLEVRKMEINTGTARLRSLNDQLSSIFSLSLQRYVVDTRKVATRESTKNCLLSKDGSCAIVLDSLQAIRQDTQTVLVDVLDKNSRPILRSPKDSLHSWSDFNGVYSSMKLESGTVGKLIRIRDSIYYSFIVAVTDKQEIIGYVVRWRLFNGNPKDLEQTRNLLGTRATIYLGNADQSLWTNMLGRVPNPVPQSVGQITDVGEYTAINGDNIGEGVIAAEKIIPGTPWLLLLELPKHTLVESSNRFLKRIILIGGALVLLAILIAWFMSRRITRPIKRLTNAISALGSGDYSTSGVSERRDEIGRLSRAFNAMAIEVQHAREDLENKVIETGQMNEQLRNLSSYLQNIREEERMHIAREMHDELGQLLTGFKMDVSWLNKRLIENKDPGVRDRLLEMTKIVDESVKFVRKLAAELRPSVLDDLGLVPALEWQSKEFTKRYSIEVELIPTSKELNISELVATGLFRIFQESLTNVARHSAATKVTATLDIIDGYICLSISDNGKGFDTITRGERKTLGLLGMKERALMIGGNLNIQSEPGKGTTVIITVPLTTDAQKSSVNSYGKEENKEWK
jgi:signal transduction histidine kinase